MWMCHVDGLILILVGILLFWHGLINTTKYILGAIVAAMVVCLVCIYSALKCRSKTVTHWFNMMTRSSLYMTLIMCIMHWFYIESICVLLYMLLIIIKVIMYVWKYDFMCSSHKLTLCLHKSSTCYQNWTDVYSCSSNNYSI